MSSEPLFGTEISGWDKNQKKEEKKQLSLEEYLKKSVELKEQKLFQPSHILLNANPVITTVTDKRDQDTINTAISNLKIHMEGDYKLSFDTGENQLTRSVILDKDTSKATVLKIKDEIIEGLKKDDEQIKKEINHLIGNNITKENI
jgi:hypothetical protein